jgi:hypothetical protein
MLHRKTKPAKVKYEFSINTSNTSLRPHLERNHLELYMTLVKEKGWSNKLLGCQAKTHTRSQTSSQTATSQGERPTIYDEANFHQLLLKFIVADDQVCSHHFVLMSNMLMQTFQSLNVVECRKFRELFHYLRPNLKESMVPH